MEIPFPRTALSSRSPSPRSSRPWKRTEPPTRAVRGSSPITASAETDFPEPDSPTMPSTSPEDTE